MLTRKQFPYLVLGVMIGFGVWAYPQLPPIIASHWNFYGEVDGYASKEYTIISLPILTLLLLLLMRGLERASAKTAWYQQTPETYQTFTNTIVLLMGLLYIVLLGSALGWQIEMPRMMVIGIGLLMLFLGNIMGRLEPNPYFGIRVPWTLNSRDVWRKTHRVFGRVWVVSGVVLFVLAWLLPVEIQFFIFLPLILLSSMGAIGYSWWLARQVNV
jgi:uncharacterized membrane protein